MQKGHKPAENSQATTDRQGKHKRAMTIIDEVPDRIPDDVIGSAAALVVGMSMTKADLIEAASALDLSTKGTKADLVARINA